MKTEENTKKEEMKNEKTAGNAVVFENPEFGKILTQTDENGEPLFCAKDVCNALGYKKPRNAVNQLVNPLDALKQGAWVSAAFTPEFSQVCAITPRKAYFMPICFTRCSNSSLSQMALFLILAR